jgi:hypothetical protein
VLCSDCWWGRVSRAPVSPGRSAGPMNVAGGMDADANAGVCPDAEG